MLKEVRGRGLFIAMEFCDGEKGYEVVTEMFKQRVLVSGNEINSRTVRIEPPLIISDDHINRALCVIENSIDIVYKKMTVLG